MQKLENYEETEMKVSELRGNALMDMFDIAKKAEASEGKWPIVECKKLANLLNLISDLEKLLPLDSEYRNQS